MSSETTVLPPENVIERKVRAPRRAPPVPNATRDMQKELAAAGALKFQLKELFGDDPDTDLLRDSIEGETDLLETVDRVLEQMARDTAHVEGIDKFAATMEARKKRISDRLSNMKTMLLGALEILEQKRIERPLALIFSKVKPPKVLITDEALIPARFFKTPDPELSKSALAEELKSHRDTIAGKMAEIADRLKDGSMTEDEAAEARERIRAAFPEIPGAELEGEGRSVQVKWS